MFVEQKLNLTNILQEQGFKYVDFKDIKNRVSSKGILTEDFIKSIVKINPFLHQLEALSFIEEKAHLDFTNKIFIKTLQDGLPKKVNNKIQQVKFIDFEHVDNNEFLVIGDYCYEKQGRKTVIDFVLYVNGLPVIIIETANEVESGLNRLKQYMEDIPSFAACEVFSASTDGFKVILRDSSEVSQYDSFVKEMLFPKSLLELIENYVIFIMNHRGFQKYIFKDYQQRAIDKTIHKLTTATEKRVGIINIQFGTGQVLTLLHLAKRILSEKVLNNAKVLVVSDRIDKDKQLTWTFNSIYGLSSGMAETANELDILLRDQSVPIIFTTVQKFREELEVNNEEIIVIVDNCYRSQSGIFAFNMRNALPNARLIGVTSSNINKKTTQLFGEIIDQFTIESAIKRGLMLPVYYENRIELGTSNHKTESSTDSDIKKKTQDIINHFNSNCHRNGQKALLVVKNRLEAIRYKEYFDEINGIFSALFISAHQQDSERIKNLLENKNEILHRFHDKDSDIKILIACSSMPISPLIQTVYLDKFLSKNLMQEVKGVVGMKYMNKDSGLIIDYDGRNRRYF